MTLVADAEQVATVRRFNRIWTRTSDLLEDSYLDSGLPLAEARLLYELRRRSPQPVVELRGLLRLDPGYTTRLLDRLAERGLVTRDTDPTDRRRQLVMLTGTGLEIAHDLNARTDVWAGKLLDPMAGGDRAALVGALDLVAEMLGVPDEDTPALIRRAEAHELGWVYSRHVEVYAAEYGWPGFAAEVARIIAGHLGRDDERGRQAFWVAERNGRLLGSVGCDEDDEQTARLRLLLVEPAARGQRLGVGLVDHCVRFAHDQGYARIVLHTQDKLTAARHIYRAAGFALMHTDDDSMDPDGKGEHWELPLL